MFCPGSLARSALVAVLLAAVVESGPAQKLTTCCTTVNKQRLTEPIKDYLVQSANPPCVTAVIFQTDSGLYCSYHKAPWVRREVAALRKAKALTTLPPAPAPPAASLLSIITSTASPSSSSAPPPSSQGSSTQQDSITSTSG